MTTAKRYADMITQLQARRAVNVARDTDLHDVELRLDDPVLLAQLQLTAQASNTTPRSFNE